MRLIQLQLKQSLIASDRLLEVGALKPDNYASWDGWIGNQPIDLRSRHPNIQEQDFLLLDQDSHRAQWDAISLSLVVNFVPDPRDRGTCLLRFIRCLPPSFFHAHSLTPVAFPACYFLYTLK